MTIASFDQVEWIDPWNDRRPMTEDWVLVTLFDSNGKYVTISRYEFDYGWFVDDDVSVLGWMPLPEPMGGYMPWGVKPKFSEEWTRQ
jgi:hypothetical protein